MTTYAHCEVIVLVYPKKTSSKIQDMSESSDEDGSNILDKEAEEGLLSDELEMEEREWEASDESDDCDDSEDNKGYIHEEAVEEILYRDRKIRRKATIDSDSDSNSEMDGNKPKTRPCVVYSSSDDEVAVCSKEQNEVSHFASSDKLESNPVSLELDNAECSSNDSDETISKQNSDGEEVLATL